MNDQGGFIVQVPACLATKVAPKGRGGAVTSTYVDHDVATPVDIRPAGLAEAISIANVVAASMRSCIMISPCPSG